MLLVGRREGHPAGKNLYFNTPIVMVLDVGGLGVLEVDRRWLHPPIPTGLMGYQGRYENDMASENQGGLTPA